VPVFLIVIPAVLLTVRSRPPGMQRMSVAEAAESLEGLRTSSLWMIVLAQFLWAFATTGSVIHLIQYLIKESTALYRNTLARSVMRFNRRAFRSRAGKKW
jgi:hypothetical protein